MSGEHHGDGQASDSGWHRFTPRWRRAAFAATAGQLLDASAAFKRADYATALRIWRSLANQGNVFAQAGLGVMYAEGFGVPRNYVEALKWYRLAADQGDAVAQAGLGVMYAEGNGVPRNYAEALKWRRLAADQGDAVAQCDLGIMYASGEGCRRITPRR